LVQVQPDDIEKVIIDVPANMTTLLKKLRVRDGQFVEKGQVIAELSSLELQNQLIEAETQRDTNDEQFVQFSSLAAGSNDADDRMKIDIRASEAKADRDKFAITVKTLEELKQNLNLKASRSGIVMSPPKIDEVGKQFERGATFCSIGDPKKLRVVMPVATKDYRILEDDLRRARANGSTLDVAVRVKGRGNQTFNGVINELPESEAKDVPVQLTTKHGGPLAVKQSQNPNVHVPQSQQFLVYVDILDPDDAICPGTLAYVKVHCRWRTGAWWIWRTFSSAFDLGADWRDVLPSFMRSKD
jgi:putative peptide zinc metalloprotease protein